MDSYSAVNGIRQRDTQHSFTVKVWI